MKGYEWENTFSHAWTNQCHVLKANKKLKLDVQIVRFDKCKSLSLIFQLIGQPQKRGLLRTFDQPANYMEYAQSSPGHKWVKS